MYKVEKVLAKLDASNIDYYEYIENLSPGQKMKLLLAKLILDNCTIMLLDEPTNHLDIEGIIFLEKFIRNFEGIIMLISHDRYFLNNICTKIFEIDEQKLIEFEGNYDDYLLLKARYIEEREKEYLFQERKRDKLESLIVRSRKIKGGVKRGKAIKAAKTRLKREVLSKEIAKYEAVNLSDFKIEGHVHSSKKILEIKDLDFSYDKEKKLIQDLDLLIYGNDKIWFYGKNGIGKTTLIKLIINKLKSQKGEIIWGPNIHWTYFSQDQSHLDLNKTVEDYFLENTSVSYDKSFGVLEKFLFPKEFRRYRIETLSPGQRARLSFAVFAQGNYNFLILDEPTNHLDIRTKEVIERSLAEFSGAILLISHDRYFVKNVGINRLITLKKNRVVEKREFEI